MIQKFDLYLYFVIKSVKSSRFNLLIQGIKTNNFHVKNSCSFIASICCCFLGNSFIWTKSYTFHPAFVFGKIDAFVGSS